MRGCWSCTRASAARSGLQLCLLYCVILVSCLHRTCSFKPTSFTMPRPRVILFSTLGSIRREVFHHSEPPFLAIITQTTACDSRERMDMAFKTLREAVSTNQVDLVSIRVSRLPSDKAYQDQHQRVVELAGRLMQLTTTHHFRLVVSSDWIDAAAEAGADGVHVKEACWPSLVPEIKQKYQNAGNFRPNLLLGTSVHSIESAQRAMELLPPDYFFVGTCYATASHPDKLVLEGPQLPGLVCRKLDETSKTSRPKVFAIGGIDDSNCDQPVRTYGADGVAVIRAVSKVEDTAQVVARLKAKMASDAI